MSTGAHLLLLNDSSHFIASLPGADAQFNSLLSSHPHLTSQFCPFLESIRLCIWTSCIAPCNTVLQSSLSGLLQGAHLGRAADTGSVVTVS